MEFSSHVTFEERFSRENSFPFALSFILFLSLSFILLGELFCEYFHFYITSISCVFPPPPRPSIIPPPSLFRYLIICIYICFSFKNLRSFIIYNVIQESMSMFWVVRFSSLNYYLIKKKKKKTGTDPVSNPFLFFVLDEIDLRSRSLIVYS